MSQIAPQLTEGLKVQIRHFLGYLNVAEAYTMTFGRPMAVEPQFWVEGAMDRMLVEAIPLVQRLVNYCELVEKQMFENMENQAVESIGNIKINKDEFTQLKDGPLKYAVEKLAQALGILPNPYAPTNGGGGMNVPVVG